MKQIKKILYSLILTSFIALSSVTVFAVPEDSSGTNGDAAAAAATTNAIDTAIDCIHAQTNTAVSTETASGWTEEGATTSAGGDFYGMFGVGMHFSSVAQKQFGNSGGYVSGC